jgi:hypothetical protein
MPQLTRREESPSPITGREGELGGGWGKDKNSVGGEEGGKDVG